MGTFIGILIGVTAIAALIIIMVNAEQEHRRQKESLGDRLVRQEEEKLAKLDEALSSFDWYPIDGKNGIIKVKRSYLDANFREGALMSEDIFFAEEDDKGYVTMTMGQLNELELKKVLYQEKQEKLTKTTELNNKGIEQEKAGDEDAAIATYEECIKIGYPATHAYDRLLTIYRNRKDYDNEQRVCIAAMGIFIDEQKYKDRLSKITSLRMGK